MPMECKSCSKVVEQAKLRPVGDSFFCQACFSALMKAPSRKEPALSSVSPSLKKSAPKVVCFICKVPLKGDPYKSMGKIAFCESCVGDLTSFKAPDSVHEPQRRIQAKPEPTAEPYYSRATRPPAEPAFGEFGEKRCSQCERRVLEPNGYTMREDEIWCPMCIRENPLPPEPAGNETEPESVSHRQEQAPQELQSPLLAELSTTPPQLSSETAWLECDSCGKSLPPPEFSIVEGYRICPPCIETDREAALHLARAKHRRQMIELLEGLNDK